MGFNSGFKGLNYKELIDQLLSEIYKTIRTLRYNRYYLRNKFGVFMYIYLFILFIYLFMYLFYLFIYLF